MAAHVYKDKEGKRLPSVTSVLSRFKAADGLINWAWKCGVDGKDYKQERQKAADAGTVAHKMVEAFLRGEDWKDDGNFAPNVIAKGRVAFENFMRWQDGTKVEIMHAEVPLVSETHKFGGCLDAIGICRTTSNGVALFDWKSSNGVWAEYLYQMAAYKILWEETYNEVPIIGGCHLCRFSKEDGNFDHRYFDELDQEEATFLHMRKLYDMIKSTEKRVK